ncbi:hypothetical protein [Hymenobacter cheonanensis]|uniref:hypothetical protein n=1 Tax=Hymenobacter sp. CA2-7 TaxID=3063993 RepID=UPI0027134522|nr:hypothetical protein [Hymenobacter sp. CA2-7]MDO7888289.1 hypothetical protein [Hymenobacter sp. CA2-7]
MEAYRRTRLIVAELRNAFRGPKDPWQAPEQVMPLPGDSAGPATAPETPEDIEALWAELDQRDAALLPTTNG